MHLSIPPYITHPYYTWLTEFFQYTLRILEENVYKYSKLRKNIKNAERGIPVEVVAGNIITRFNVCFAVDNFDVLLFMNFYFS